MQRFGNGECSDECGMLQENQMPKGRERDGNAPPLDGARSFGSGLDEVGWEPKSEPRRLKPRLERTIEQVRIEFEKALNAIAAEGRFGGPAVHSTELEMLEEATKLVKEALTDREGRIRDR